MNTAIRFPVTQVISALCVGVALAVLVLLSETPAALGAPPANDGLAAAQAVPVPGQSTPVSNTEATTELGEPAPSCTGTGSRTVWYKAQHAETVSVIADTLPSNYDTVLAVFSGPANANLFSGLTPVACNNDFNGVQSRVTFTMTAGTWYYFQVAQIGASSGTAILRIGNPPANDNFADAIPLPTPQQPGVVATGATFMGTTETGENTPSCLGADPFGQSVWYQWTSPNAPGHVVWEASGTSAAFAIYTGPGFPLTEVHCGVGTTVETYGSATTFFLQMGWTCSGLSCFNGPPAAGFSLTMLMGSILYVDSTADTNVPDSDLTLREALHLSQGTLGRAPTAGEDFLFAAYGISAGAATGDLVYTSFPCGMFCNPIVNSTIGSSLPSLATGNDVIRGLGRPLRISGSDLNFNCLSVPGNNNRIEGLEFEQCDGASFPAGIRVTGSNNVIGSSLSGDGNGFYQNGVGLAFNPPGTGNVAIGNAFGVVALGIAGNPANDVGFAITGANNALGGSAAGEGNTFGSSIFEQVVIRGAGAGGNIIQGNQIGGNTITSGQGVRIDTSGHDNTIGGSNSGEGNIISGATIGVLIQSGPNNHVVGNKIGTNAAGDAAAPNHTGVFVQGPASTITIGGSTPGAGNIISSSTNEGIVISGSNDNTIRGNYIGTNAAGTAALPNTFGIGLYDSASNTIGGPAAGEGNLISGNSGAGIWIDNSGGNNGAGHVFKGNLIGTNSAGNGALSNGTYGIAIENSDLHTIGGVSTGDANVIGYSGSDGVYIGTGSIQNSVRGNSIHSNGGLAIDLADNGVSSNDTDDHDGGPNNFQNFPVITAAVDLGSGQTKVMGTLDGLSLTTFTLDLYSNGSGGPCDTSGHGEGLTYLASATATTPAPPAFNDPNQGRRDGVFSAIVPATINTQVTATATDPAGNTSEFSACVLVDGNADDDDDPDTLDNCPTWPNSSQAPPPLWTVPDNDSDCDGFTDDREVYLGTHPARQCAFTARPTTNDSRPPAGRST